MQKVHFDFILLMELLLLLPTSYFGLVDVRIPKRINQSKSRLRVTQRNLTEPLLTFTKVKLIPLYQLQNYDKN